MGKSKKHKIPDDLALEIKSREILVKRLEKPFASLQRAVDKENAAREKRNLELSEYESEHEAHEAYGYGFITWDEYETIRKRFEDVEHAEQVPSTPTAAALEILREFTSRLKYEIRSFNWDALPDEEKQRIEAANAEVRERVEKRRVGLL